MHFLILASAVAPAFGQVFKWVDERGVTHYGERPPQGGKASEVPDKLGTPGGVAPRASQGDAKPLEPEKTEEAKRREQCDQQRELLDRLVQNELGSGKVQIDRANAIARQEKLVAERCKGL